MTGEKRIAACLRRKRTERAYCICTFLSSKQPQSFPAVKKFHRHKQVKVPWLRKIQSFGRAQQITTPDRLSVLTKVFFSFLDASEDLLKESFILRLLAIFQDHSQIGRSSWAGQAAASPVAREGAARCLDGFMAGFVWGLLASPQKLIIFHLRNTHTHKGSALINMDPETHFSFINCTRHSMNTPPAARCTVHPPHWAERCLSVSLPLLALYTAAHGHGESHLGLSLSTHCHCYTSVGCIFFALHRFLPSPLSHSDIGWTFLLRQRILYQATAFGPVF